MDENPQPVLKAEIGTKKMLSADLDPSDAIPQAADDVVVPPIISMSLEIFIHDDTIINTQGSANMEGDDSKMVNGQNDEDKNPRPNDMIPEVVEIPPSPSRKSDRLKKTTTLTTMEKNQKMAKKRNIEGNPSCSDSFSVLTINEVVNISF
jgi:hypothetical protein